MDNTAVFSGVCDTAFVETVDYSGLETFKDSGAMFHWWDSVRTSMHRHTHCEFFIITQGCASHILNGERQVLTKNTLYALRPSDTHQFAPLERMPCTHINLAVSEGRLLALCEAMGFTLAEFFDEGARSCTLRDDELAFFLSKAERLSCLAREGQETASRIIVYEMISQAAALLRVRGLTGEVKSPDWFEALVRKINSPEHISCTAAEVYEMSGFSPPVCIEHFKRYKGVTVAGYLRDAKMNCACELLRTTGLSTIDISGRLGYESLSHFNRIFKNHTGKTPREYRNLPQ